MIDVQVLCLDEMQMMQEQLKLLDATPDLGTLRAKQIIHAIGHFHETGLGREHGIAIMTVAAGTQVPQLDNMLPTDFLPCK